jgi:DNA-binding NtrC family response regulator
MSYFIEIKGEIELGTIERLIIINRLEELNNNKTQTAKSLGINIRTLRTKLQKYGYEPKSTPTASVLSE